MQGFARETRLSETTFVQAATEAGADYRNRIFMTTRELPFAGHPSLGTAVAVALARGDGEVRYVQQTAAGLQPIDVRVDGRAAHAEMLQEPPDFGPEVEAAEVLPAVGLDASDAHAADLPPQVVSTGLPPLIVPVRRAALGRARPAAAGAPRGAAAAARPGGAGGARRRPPRPRRGVRAARALRRDDVLPRRLGAGRGPGRHPQLLRRRRRDHRGPGDGIGGRPAA